MKNIIIAIILLLAVGETHAQKWFPQNVRWVYGIEIVGANTFNLPIEIIHDKDTIIEGKECRKFISRIKGSDGQWKDYSLNSFGSFASCYMFNDTMSHIQYVYYKNRFQVLYNFNKQVGDTLFIPSFGEIRADFATDSGAWVIVDSIGVDTIRGLPYRTMCYKELKRNDWFFGGKIIEGIGNTFGFYPYPNNQPYAPFFTGIRCYNGDTIEIKFNHIPCDSVISTSLDEYQKIKNNIGIHPNPFANNLTIDLSRLNQKASKITIINRIGQVVLNNEIINNDNIIDLLTEYLDSGLYFCIITIKNNSFTYKIIKP